MTIGPAAVLVLPPGQEEAVATLLGRDAKLPGGCRLEGAEIQQAAIEARYRCGDTLAVARLGLAEAGDGSGAEPGHLAVRSGTDLPAALSEALAARTASAGGALRWASVSDDQRGDHPPAPEQRAGWSAWTGPASLLLLLAAALAAGWWWRRRRSSRPPAHAASSSGARRVRPLPALAAALGLVGGAHLLLLGLGRSLLAPLEARPVLALAPALLASLAGLAAVLASGRWLGCLSARRRAALVTVVALACLGVGLLMVTAAAPRPGFAGLVLHAGADVRERAPRRGEHVYHLDPLGFRGAGFALQPAPGVHRLVLIGDSFVFGSGVAEQGTLAAALARRLARLGGPPVEVLNLGVLGHNLGSHVDLYEAAARELAPEVVVLALTIPNDLSRWDVQVARREALRPGLFSLARLLLGEGAAQAAFDLALLEREVTPEGLRHLGEQVARLARLRRGPSPRLIFFRYSPTELEVDGVLQTLPGATVLGPGQFSADHFIPGDGHPTAAGNQAFAEVIEEALRAAGWPEAGGPAPPTP